MKVFEKEVGHVNREFALKIKFFDIQELEVKSLYYEK